MKHYFCGVHFRTLLIEVGYWQGRMVTKAFISRKWRWLRAILVKWYDRTVVTIVNWHFSADQATYLFLFLVIVTRDIASLLGFTVNCWSVSHMKQENAHNSSAARGSKSYFMRYMYYDKWTISMSTLLPLLSLIRSRDTFTECLRTLYSYNVS